ncbi:MAG: methylated-DNA--[protein]-cysteine S-methyltransferase [candidate division Zixibacteria bacterium]|nr:methylated-DNA--[protein]-cysteine S-methyltransferase [candidate division Zixibacteria bacterium]MDH3938317.1 methylated-DNA--[protein]-cysteine S-methyltransferase [candidate division Zixibacteria bacterium]MDH4035060.1 methylated-DNA--[protein]-cysteine S-methyltransferase [candidate division Zixibacteria bacterium]
MILYQDFESPIGPMIGGATDQGICFLEWHDRGGVDVILNRVRKRYKTEVAPGHNDHLTSLTDELSRYFTGDLKQFRTAIDITGTSFEQVVWKQLQKIDYGRTCSYGELAAKLDKPGAARAVGRANGANYLSIVIPCHRVIEANGNLRGYGGKVWRKKYLLELEAGVRQPHLPAEAEPGNLKTVSTVL